jgi:hypothetical protein
MSYPDPIRTGAEDALYWLACNFPDAMADAMRFTPSMLAEYRFERQAVERLLAAHEEATRA